MICGKITNFLIILQAIIVQNKEFQSKHPFLSKLVNSSLFKHDSEQTTPEYYDQCKPNCLSKSVSPNRRNGARFVRFIDRSTNDSNEEHEMEAPATKESFLDLLTGEGGEGEEEEEEEEEDDDDDDDDKKEEKKGDKLEVSNKEQAQEDEEQDLKLKAKKNKMKEKLKENDKNDDYDDDDGGDDDDDDDDYDFFSDDNDNSKEKVDDTNISPSKEGEGKWPRQGIRRRKKFQTFIFFLLLAYKLKFFTVIPFLIKLLVLLLGTTGMAGFFFALFSAALGLHNTHYH